jgi:ubiquinone/menaquinone biosynthesis C-methylase UbiE
LAEHFAERYRLGQAPIMLEVERAFCGCDYGGTSWTTRAEADRLGPLLELGPGRRLLDVGAGSGWPGLYLGRVTGCDVTLVDVPLQGIRTAAKRAAAEELAGACWVAVADGSQLPFEREGFDAVSHSDLLCCLEAKHSVLKECRRVARGGAKMAFTVISIASDLLSADYQRAVEFGPPFVESALEYPALLDRSGWRTTDYVDVTAEYAATVRRLLSAWEEREDRLADLLGAAEFSAMVTRRRGGLAAIEDGLLKRELFVTTTDAVGPT